MHEHIAKEWIARLRSGGYAQGASALCEVGLNGKPDKFCCLGILCEMFLDYNEGFPLDEANIINITTDVVDEDDCPVDGIHPPPPNTRMRMVRVYGNRIDFPPDCVREWAGFHNNDLNGSFAYIDQNGKLVHSSLVYMNDVGKSFGDIANAIEQNWEVL